MALVKRLLRYLVYTVLVLVAFAVGAAAVLTLTERGRDNLASIISRTASTPDRTITVSGLEGVWSGRLRLGTLVVGDREGAWLVARDVAVDWSPLKLFSGVFDASRVAASRVELARLPAPARTAEPSSGGGLPVSLRLRGIDLPDIALGEILAGNVAAIAAKGSAVVEGSPLLVETDLDITRTDGRPGNLVAAVIFAPADNRLDVNVKGSEPAGGIIANLLKLPGAPPVDIEVMGSGPLADWRGSGTIAIDGQVVSRINARHQQTPAGSRIEATGEGEFAQFVPATLQSLLAGSTSFDVAGTATSGGGLAIERAQVETGVLSATASGTLDPAGANDLTVDLMAKGDAGVPLAFGSPESPITLVVNALQARAVGAGGAPALDINGTLASLSTNDVRLRGIDLKLHSDAFDIQTRTGPVKGDLTAAELTIENPTVSPLVAGEVRLGLAGSLAADSITVDRGTFASDALDGTLSGTVSLATGAVTLNLNADVASAALPAPARPVLAERTTLSATLLRDTQGQLSANPFQVTSGEQTASGSFSLNDGAVEANLSGHLGTVALLAPQLSGPLDFTVAATGPLSAPDFSLQASSGKLTGFGRELDAAQLRATGKADLANPSATVELTGALGGQPLELKGAVAQADGVRTVKGLSLTLAGNAVTGDLTLGADFSPEGTLALALPDIAPLAGLVGETASGALNGTAVFARENGVPTVTVDATSSALARGDLSVRDASVQAKVADYLAAPTVNGTVTAAGLSAGGTQVTGIRLDLSRTGAATGFDGGATVSGIPLMAAGEVAIAAGAIDVTLTAAQAQLQDYKATLALPTTVRIADGITTLEEFAVEVAGGVATLNGTVGQSLDVGAVFEAPQDGSLLTFGTADNPVNFTVKSASLTAKGPAAAPALDLTGTFTRVSTKSAQIEQLVIQLASPAFTFASRAGDVTGKAVADAFKIDDPTISPLVSGRLEADLAGVLTTEDLTVTSGRLRSDALDGGFTGRISLADGTMAMDLTADLLSSALPAAARGILGERTQVSAKISRDRQGGLLADRLSITSDGVDASGRVSLGNQQIDASLNGTLQDVGRLSPGATGSVDFSATAKGETAAPDVVFNLESDRIEAAGQAITGLKLTANAKADLANPSGTVSLTGNVAGQPLTGSASLSTANGERRVQDLAVSLGQNRIDGDLTLDENFLPLGTVNFALPDIAPLAALALEKVSGQANGTVTFSNQNGEPQLAVKAEVPAAARADVSARGVSIDATVTNYIAAPVVAGRVRAANVTSGTTAVSDIDVNLTRDGGWTGFDGAATVGDIPARATGRVQVVNGQTRIEIRSGEATVNGIRIPLGASSGIAIENGSAALNDVTVDLGGGSARISGTAGENLDLTVVLTEVPASLANQFAPALNAAGTIDGTVKVTGQAANPNADFSLRLAGFEVAQTRAAGLGPVAAEATGSFADKRLTFDSTLTGRQGLSLRGTGSVDLTNPSNPAIDVDLKLAALPASLANASAPGLDAAGTISGTAKITGSPSAPAARFDLNLTGGQTSQTRAAGLGAVGAVLSGTFQGGRLTFDANANSSAGLTINGDGTVDVSSQALSVNLTGRLPFTTVASQLAAQGLGLTGSADFDVQIRGTPSAPSVTGSIRAAGARLVDSRSGIAVNNLSADIALGGTVATVRTLTGTFSTGGTLAVSGTIGIAPAQGFPADLTVRVADGRYTDGRVVTSTLSGDLAVRGPLVSAPVVSGTVDLGRTVITIPNRLPTSLSALDVQHENASEAVRRQDRALNPPDKASGSSSGLQLDITVNANNQIFVQGRGLDAELGGSLRLSGPASAPQAVGQFTLNRGRLSLLGRRLNFTSGTITFSGTLVPYINLVAEADTGDNTTATVTVDGPANNPRFLFASVPVLPEDEVLSRLIFGRSLSNLSPLQIAQLADAAAQLAGGGGTSSLLQSLQSGLGVDDLDVRTDEEGDTTLAIGKYLNDRTYFSLEAGDGVGGGKAQIDLDVGKGVKLRGSAAGDGEARGGIFYEREY